MVGLKPNPPQNVSRVNILSETSIQISFEEGSEIQDNPPTLAYRVYLDNGTGNDAELVYDTGRKALTNLITLSDLKIGHSYQVTVTQVNQIGESIPSSALTIHTGVPPS